jgi:predicted  nucleic acid-binding Zn-ribbon protein
LVLKADVAQQRSLLELAEIDAELSRLAHRATHLPEQQSYDQVLADQRAAADRAAVLAIALEDLDAQVAKLESEVDSVRKREDRDRGLLDSGSVTNSKQLEELQHELGTLERRQASLEDTLLEVMERREQLADDHSREQASADTLAQDLAAAGQSRDVALGEVEGVRAERGVRRTEVVAAIDGDLLDLYERLRKASGIGAGRLLGHRCGACRIELDRGELSRIAAAPDDEVLRCSECRAILLRLPGPV